MINEYMYDIDLNHCSSCVSLIKKKNSIGNKEPIKCPGVPLSKTEIQHKCFSTAHYRCYAV